MTKTAMSMEQMEKRPVGRPHKWRRSRSVRYAVEETEDGIMNILAVGLTWVQMADVMDWLRAAYRKAELRRERMMPIQNGHIPEFFVLSLTDRDKQFCNVDDLAMLFETRCRAVVKQTCDVMDIKKISINKLINS